jgi:long-chain acyl-CoA synthetase
VKTVLLGAAPVAISDIREGHTLFGDKLWNGYGQGESPCTITAMSKTMIADALRSGDLGRLASVGIARTGIELGVVDGDGRPLAQGEIGEIVVRGATVMQGYLNRPDASAETVRNGWLQTGDIGRLDEAGFLTLLDRKKDVIISGGVNIYAREVEDALVACADVLEVAVIGIPDADWGESVMAVIVPKPGATPDTAMLDGLCLERLARFKRPKHYAFVEALPKNASGKVVKGELRKRHGGVPA